MEKNGVIVCYSWIGSTRVAAQEISRLTGFEVKEIQEVRKRKIGNVMWAALGAVLGMSSWIKPLNAELKQYDTILLGAQVWAGKTTPAINAFIRKTDFSGKKVWIFITKSDDNVPQTVIDSITKRIEKRGATMMGSLSLTTHWDPQTNTPIKVEEVREDIRNWVENDLK